MRSLSEAVSLLEWAFCTEIRSSKWLRIVRWSHKNSQPWTLELELSNMQTLLICKLTVSRISMLGWPAFKNTVCGYMDSLSLVYKKDNSSIRLSFGSYMVRLAWDCEWTGNHSSFRIKYSAKEVPEKIDLTDISLLPKSIVNFWYRQGLWSLWVESPWLWLRNRIGIETVGKIRAT